MSGMERFTERSRRVLELSLREALSLGHNYVGTEHILLGLVRDNEGLAGKVLDALGVTADAVRDEVIRQLTVAREPKKEPAEDKLADLVSALKAAIKAYEEKP